MCEHAIVRRMKNVIRNIFSFIIVLIFIFIGTTIFRYVWFISENSYKFQDEIKAYGEWNRDKTPESLKIETEKGKVVQLKGKVAIFLDSIVNYKSSDENKLKDNKIIDNSDEKKLKKDNEIFDNNTEDGGLRYYNGIESSDYKVNVNYASFHIPVKPPTSPENPEKKLDPIEIFNRDDKPLFAIFAKFFCDSYKENDKGGQTVSKNNQEAPDYIPNLAKLIELENPRIIIRMLYILNTTTYTQVIFPGTKLTASGYDATQRPWYLEYEANNKSSKFNDGEFTAAYQDFVVKGIVRTYIKKITFEKREYIFCVDFVWKSDYENENFLANFSKAISIWDSFFVTVLSFIFLLVIQGIFFTNKTHVSKFLFGERLHYLNANSDKKLTLRDNIEHSMSTDIGIGFSGKTKAFGGNIIISEETKNGNSIVEDEVFSVNASENPSLRGIEYWRFYLKIIIGLNALGIPFNIFRKYYFCALICKYYPDSDLIFDFRGLSSQRIDLDRLEENEKDKICKYIKRLVHITNGRGNFINVPLNKHLPIPDSHNRISNRGLEESDLFLDSYNPNEEAYSRPILENRLPFKEGLSFLKNIYSNQEVNSVCKDRYLEALLKDDNIYNLDLLSSGSKIRRIILYESSEYLEYIIRTYKNELKKLISNHTKVKGHTIFISSVKDLSESLKDFTEKDFALVGENLVVVTNELYKESILGNDEGGIKIEGYISWRDVDVKFYRKLFDLIQQKKKYLWEVIQEYDKSIAKSK